MLQLIFGLADWIDEKLLRIEIWIQVQVRIEQSVIVYSKSKAFSITLRTVFFILYNLIFPLQNMERGERCQGQRYSRSTLFCHMVLRFCTDIKLNFHIAETMNTPWCWLMISKAWLQNLGCRTFFLLYFMYQGILLANITNLRYG